MTGLAASDAVSSLAEEVARAAGGLEHVESTHLPVWLPGLTIPPTWTAALVDGNRATRVLLRQSATDGSLWSGCEVLNLYRVPAVVPDKVMVDNADRTLKDGGATEISVGRVEVPPQCGVVGTHASGWLVDHRGEHVHGQFRYYAVNAAGGSALIEQAVVISAEDVATLAGEASALVEHLRQCLLASVARSHVSKS